MSKIICKAYFLQPAADTIIAVSPSFQAALTPWILTLSAEKCRFSCWMTEIASFALSPTFQFTRSLAVHLRTYEEKQQLMNTDLCAPLFSHLKTLKLSYSSGYTVRFDHGNDVADFVLKFQRLENFELSSHPESTPPSELIGFYVRLFHSRSISQSLLVSIVKSFTNNIRRCYKSDFFFRSATTQEEYSELLIKHKVIPYLVQKMVEVYRNDHGESLGVFLDAIEYSLRLRNYSRWTESDGIDELVPMFDLLETIVINGDLLHSCFQTRYNKTSDPAEQKWRLSVVLADFLTHLVYYYPLDLMRLYGRTLLPQLADAIFSKFDGSVAAFTALLRCLDVFRLVIDDYFWADEVESKTDKEGLKKTLEAGRKLLQHYPFKKLEFVITKAIVIDHCPFSDKWIGYFSMFVSGLISYCNRVASLSSELNEAVVRDVASALIEHHILPLCFDFVVSSFVDYETDRGARERSSQLLGGLCLFLQPINSRTTDQLSSVLAKDFFLRDGIVQKILHFGDAVRDDFEEVFNMLRYTIQNKTLRNEKLSARDKKNIKSYTRLTVQLAESFFLHLMFIRTNTISMMLQGESQAILLRNGRYVLHDSIIELKNAEAKLSELEARFKKFQEENRRYLGGYLTSIQLF